MGRKICRQLSTIVLAGLVMISSGGCKPDAAVKQPEIIGRGTRDPGSPPKTEPQTPTGAVPDITPEVPPPQQATGTISGTIFFSGKPPAMTIDTSQDPACSLGSEPRLPVEQYVAKNGKLANVFLYVKSGPPEATQSGPLPPPVVLDQKNCQYVPHVIGVMQGGYVEFHNSDPTMHNVHAMPTDVGNQTIDISMGPRGQPQTKQFLRPELMIPVRCNNHPWMNAFINVSATPFFAVSDANGHFDLRGLPPGDYVIGAVQEKMGEKTMNVTVAPNSAAKAEFRFAM